MGNIESYWRGRDSSPALWVMSERVRKASEGNADFLDVRLVHSRNICFWPNGGAIDFMNAQKINSRSGTTDDVEGILAVVGKAFKVEENSPRWHRWYNKIVDKAEHYRVLEMAERIIAVAYIARKRFRVGSCEIVNGDVGEVSVLPELQGNGYGSALMTHVVQWMRNNGYHVSGLNGYPIFYGRFGYVPFPCRYVEFPMEPVPAGVTDISLKEMLRPSKGLPGGVRLYDASRDAIRRDELYQIFNKGRSGSVVQDFSPNAEVSATPSAPDPLRIVYEANGVVEGYLFASNGGNRIRELAFNPSRPDALVGLIKQVLHIAAENKVESVISRLPFDATILPILTQSNMAFNLSERQGGYASNMIQIINPESLMRKITPELESRLRASILTNSCCEIGIGFGDQSIGLQVKAGTITSGVLIGKDVVCMRTDQATLMKLIYGMLSFDEAPVLNRESIGLLEAAILRTWFPRQHTASDGWG